MKRTYNWLHIGEWASMKTTPVDVYSDFGRPFHYSLLDTTRNDPLGVLTIYQRQWKGPLDARSSLVIPSQSVPVAGLPRILQLPSYEMAWSLCVLPGHLLLLILLLPLSDVADCTFTAHEREESD